MTEKMIEILGGEPGSPGRYLPYVYDQSINQYLGPVIPDAYKMDKEEIQEIFGGTQLPPVSIAVIDTGVLHSHPIIKKCLIESVDFTGEGPEDHNGHGTIVSLLAIGDNPQTRIYSVKALDSYGRGTPEALVDAIEWASTKADVSVINISAGIYRKKWGLFECKGDCELCQAAERASLKGKFIVAAAGNEAGKTYCPAKIGLIREDVGVLAVGAVDVEGKPLKTSGKGSVYAIGEHKFRPIT